MRRNLKYWKWRPVETVSENLRAWWQYAITCQMEVIRKRNENRNLEVVVRKCRENVVYVEAFKAHLTHPVTMDKELKAHMDDMDRERSYEELKALREVAVAQLKFEKGDVEASPSKAAKDASPQEDENVLALEFEGMHEEETAVSATPPAPSLLQYYFPGWWQSNQEQQEQELLAPEFAYRADEASITSSASVLEEELLEALADDVNLVAYKDVVFAQFSFRLGQASLKMQTEDLATKSKQVIFQCDFDDVELKMETRPRTKSYMLSMALGGLYLRDKITADTVYPLLVSPQNKVGHNGRMSSTSSALGGEPLFSLLYETRPYMVPNQKQRIDFR